MVLNNLQSLNQIEVSNNLIISSTGNYNISNSSNNLLIGNDIIINDSSYSIVVGSDLVKNKNSSYSFAFGNNYVYNNSSNNSFAVGNHYIHNNSSNNSLAFGNTNVYNTNNSNNSLAFGYSVKNSNYSHNSLAFGNNVNNSNSPYSIAFGNNVNNSDVSYSYLFGERLKNTESSHSFITGKYNLDLSNVSFAIGNGSDGVRSNLLTVYNNTQPNQLVLDGSMQVTGNLILNTGSSIIINSSSGSSSLSIINPNSNTEKNSINNNLNNMNSLLNNLGGNIITSYLNNYNKYFFAGGWLTNEYDQILGKIIITDNCLNEITSDNTTIQTIIKDNNLKNIKDIIEINDDRFLLLCDNSMSLTSNNYLFSIKSSLNTPFNIYTVNQSIINSFGSLSTINDKILLDNIIFYDENYLIVCGSIFRMDTDPSGWNYALFCINLNNPTSNNSTENSAMAIANFPSFSDDINNPDKCKSVTLNKNTNPYTLFFGGTGTNRNTSIKESRIIKFNDTIDKFGNDTGWIFKKIDSCKEINRLLFSDIFDCLFILGSDYNDNTILIITTDYINFNPSVIINLNNINFLFIKHFEEINLSNIKILYITHRLKLTYTFDKFNWITIDYSSQFNLSTRFLNYNYTLDKFALFGISENLFEYTLSTNTITTISTLQDNTKEQIMNFTGLHGNNNNLDKSINNLHNGLIVSTNNSYINIDFSIYPTIDESLPYCNLTTKENDKSVFGVVSSKNPNKLRINSLGEGAMWICNINGNLENGDYITSSNIPGYGQKQTLNEGILCNFTVAKITANCEFNLTKNVKKKVKTLSGSNGEDILEYDENNQIQYIDDLDENGNQQLVYKYNTRFIDLQGNILKDSEGNNLELTQEELDLRISNGEKIYIACFIGCTYHCG